MSRIKNALVYFKNGKDQIVPIEYCENFHITNKQEFRPQKCKVWIKGTHGKDKDDCLLNAQMLLVGSSISDISRQRAEKRVRFPNIRTMSSFSSSSGNIRKSKTPVIKKANKKKNNFLTEKAKQHMNESIMKKHDKLINDCSSIDSSSESESDHGSMSTIEKIESSDTIHFDSVMGDLEETIDDTHNANPVDVEEDTNGQEESGSDSSVPSEAVTKKGKGKPRIIASENFGKNQDPFGIASNILRQRKLVNLSPNASETNVQHGPGTSQNSNKPTLNQEKRAVERNTLNASETNVQNGPGMNQRTNKPASNQQKRAVERNTKLGNNTPARDRFCPTVRGDQVHIGLDYYMDTDTWESINRKRDSLFVKDLCLKFWGNEVLQRKCLDLSRVHNDRANRERITPEKEQLVEDLLYKKLTDSQVKGHKRLSRLKKVGKYISEKIYDVRRKLNGENE